MEEIYVANVTVRGVKSLLQNDSFGSDDGKGGKKGKVYDDKEEAEKRLIKDVQGRICQKATHLEGCLVKAAVEMKFSGKKSYKEVMKAGVSVIPDLIPHKNLKWVINKNSVKIGPSRIMRCRPEFPSGWELSFQIRCTDNRLQPLVLKNILEEGGKYVGIGDWRPKYGLFEVVSFEVNGNGNKPKKRMSL